MKRLVWEACIPTKAGKCGDLLIFTMVNCHQSTKTGVCINLDIPGYIYILYIYVCLCVYANTINRYIDI